MAGLRNEMNVNRATARAFARLFVCLFHFVQQGLRPWHLCLVHHQLNASYSVAKNRIDGNGVFILQPGADALFFQPL